MRKLSFHILAILLTLVLLSCSEMKVTSSKTVEIKAYNPDCILWLTCFDITHPHIVNSKMFQEIDWLMNEEGDVAKIDSIKSMVGENTRLITCLANWNKKDAKTVVVDAMNNGVGLYGFVKPDSTSLLPPIAHYL